MGQYFTKEGLEKLKEELRFLKNEKQREIAQQLNQAASFGDLSENAAYHQAKETRKELLNRTIELERILKGAKVVDGNTNDKVSLGCLVILECDEEKERFQLVCAEEANIRENKISSQSPLGKALMGKKMGEELELKTEYSKIKYKIVGIE